MKRLMPAAACFAFISWLGLPPALADPKSDWVEKYYRNFQQTDGTDIIFSSMRFRAEVPESDRDELFACILDRGAQDPTNGTAAAAVLRSLEAKARTWTWSAHLERAVLAQAKHKDPYVRKFLAKALAAYDKAKYRDLILSYLDDPNPQAQLGAVTAVCRWPDAKSILGGYVQRHAVNPQDPADPVTIAKQFLVD